MALQPYSPILSEDAAGIVFTPLAPLALAEDAMEQAALESADLGLSDAELLGAIYEQYLHAGFVHYVLRRGAWQQVPQDSAEELARAIADQIYRAKISASLSVIQKSLAVWCVGFVGATFCALPMAEGAKVAILPSSILGPILALLEQPKRRSENLKQARSIFG